MSVQGVPVRHGGAGNPDPRSPVTVLEVKVTGFDMPFVNLVGFFFKAAAAALPAVIAVAIVYAAIRAVLSAIPG